MQVFISLLALGAKDHLPTTVRLSADAINVDFLQCNETFFDKLFGKKESKMFSVGAASF